MKLHFADYHMDPTNRTIRYFRNSKCGVRGTSLSISNTKCGTVLKARAFIAAKKNRADSVCIRCNQQFGAFVTEFKELRAAEATA